MSLSPQWLDELRSRISLSSLIGRTVRVQKAGREFKACCPFHNEKTPSFYINDDKGFYHCFGCSAHGDAIRWITDLRGMPFMDAVKELAAEAGLEVPAMDPQAAKRAEVQASLHDVMAAAQAFFVESLAAPVGAEARRYLEQRGFPAKIAKEFGFGFAPDARQALKPALGRFDEGMLIEAGLRIAVDEKEPYDRFRGRLMLPIADARGRIIAFGGRVIGAGEPKYLNSPDTPLFDKGRTLYNLHRAAPTSRQSGRVIVVEGYMDVVALAAAGFGEAVAPLGTALTEHQIERLWKLTETPILCFDGDAAGQRAAMRAITRALPLLRPGHSLAIATLPAGMDPDDLLSRDGPAAMEKLLGEARPLVDRLWAFEAAAAPLATPEDKAGLKARLMAHVDTIADADIQKLYRRELLDRFGALAYPQRIATAQATNWGGGRVNASTKRLVSPAPSGAAKAISRNGLADQLEGAILAQLQANPAAVHAHFDLLQQLEPRQRERRDALDRLLAHSNPAGVEPGGANTISNSSGGLTSAELGEAIRLLVERPAIEAALREVLGRFESDPDAAFAEQQRLRERKLAFERRLLQLAGIMPAGDPQGRAN